MRTKQKTEIRILLAPRPGTRPLSRSVARAARVLARQNGIRLDSQPLDSHDNRQREQEMKSASEWNSLLLTARAQRGPQWDVATQMYMVDRDSQLYYDPEPLNSAQLSANSDEAGPASATSPPPSPSANGQYLEPNHRGSHPATPGYRGESTPVTDRGFRRSTRMVNGRDGH